MWMCGTCMLFVFLTGMTCSRPFSPQESRPGSTIRCRCISVAPTLAREFVKARSLLQRMPPADSFPLPLYPHITEAQQERVVGALIEARKWS